MEWEQRSLRLCAGILLSAVLLRLGADGAYAPVGRLLEDSRAASFLVYLQTGRVVRLSEQTSHPVPSAAPVTQPQPPAPEIPVFTPEDADGLAITNNSPCQPDLPALAARPLSWDLTADGPRVLILHTHTTESYTKAPGDTYDETSAYRTLDPGHNMLFLGDLVESMLTEAGIGVIHDETFHDYPSYNGSYDHAADAIREILEQYPSIELVLDLHRDAADTAYGQLVTQCSVGGQTAAQLMMVVGTGAGRTTQPDWESNLSLALKLQILLERENPGICRDVQLASQRYNQHLGSHALLIEIGAAGNTLAESAIAARQLAEAIICLSHGSAPD